MLHKQILTQEQFELLPVIKLFSPEFYLVGGTAIALQLGHRRSIDFDLFSDKPINRDQLKKTLDTTPFKFQVTFEDGDQLHGLINNTHLTFYEYPHHVPATEPFDDIILMPNLLDLAAMKAFALGMRAKWKDYVDLYFILKNHHSFDAIKNRAEALFGTWFNAKLFRQQLTYYQDVNRVDPIEYLGEPVPNDEIEKVLTDIATQPF
jgi:hypothetical protein